MRPFGSGACLKCAVPSAVARAQQVESARSDQPDLRRFFADQSIFRSDRADPQAVGGQTRPRRDIASPTQNESNIGCKRIRLPVIGGAHVQAFFGKDGGVPVRRGLHYPAVELVLGDLRKKLILDVGCGDGLFPRLLAE